jgi:hypothetical protein
MQPCSTILVSSMPWSRPGNQFKLQPQYHQSISGPNEDRVGLNHPIKSKCLVIGKVFDAPTGDHRIQSCTSEWGPLLHARRKWQWVGCSRRGARLPRGSTRCGGEIRWTYLYARQPPQSAWPKGSSYSVNCSLFPHNLVLLDSKDENSAISISYAHIITLHWKTPLENFPLSSPIVTATMAKIDVNFSLAAACRSCISSIKGPRATGLAIRYHSC